MIDRKNNTWVLPVSLCQCARQYLHQNLACSMCITNCHNAVHKRVFLEEWKSFATGFELKIYWFWLIHSMCFCMTHLPRVDEFQKKIELIVRYFDTISTHPGLALLTKILRLELKRNVTQLEAPYKITSRTITLAKKILILHAFVDPSLWKMISVFQWNFNQNTKFFIRENTEHTAYENTVCEMAPILSRERWVKYLRKLWLPKHHDINTRISPFNTRFIMRQVPNICIHITYVKISFT